MTQCYHYDPISREYLSLTEEVDESPLEPGVYYPPAHATLVEPPEVAARQVAVYIEEEWRVLDDWRGVALYSTRNGSAVSISEIGQKPIDVEATELPMPDDTHSWSGSAWELDAAKVAEKLASEKLAAVAEISELIAMQRAAAAGTTDALELQARARKRLVAINVLAGTATEDETLYISIEARLRGLGETVDDLCKKIIAKADAQDLLNAKLDGMMGGARREIPLVGTREELLSLMEDLRQQIASVGDLGGGV